MNWEGPFQLRDLLENSTTENYPWPPADKGVYLVSLESWDTAPTKACIPLYAGGNTGKSDRFCTRIEDLVADMVGFYDGGTGHHSGGQKLWEYCNKHVVKPLDLFLGWDADITCPRCDEIELYEALKPELNQKRPPQCSEHQG